MDTSHAYPTRQPFWYLAVWAFDDAETMPEADDPNRLTVRVQPAVGAQLWRCLGPVPEDMARAELWAKTAGDRDFAKVGVFPERPPEPRTPRHVQPQLQIPIRFETVYHKGILPRQRYDYRVRFVDRRGRVIEETAIQSVQTLPQVLIEATRSEDRVHVTWTLAGVAEDSATHWRSVFACGGIQRTPVVVGRRGEWSTTVAEFATASLHVYEETAAPATVTGAPSLTKAACCEPRVYMFNARRHAAQAGWIANPAESVGTVPQLSSGYPYFSLRMPISHEPFVLERDTGAGWQPVTEAKMERLDIAEDGSVRAFQQQDGRWLPTPERQMKSRGAGMKPGAWQISHWEERRAPDDQAIHIAHYQARLPAAPDDTTSVRFSTISMPDTPIRCEAVAADRVVLRLPDSTFRRDQWLAPPCWTVYRVEESIPLYLLHANKGYVRIWHGPVGEHQVVDTNVTPGAVYRYALRLSGTVDTYWSLGRDGVSRSGPKHISRKTHMGWFDGCRVPVPPAARPVLSIMAGDANTTMLVDAVRSRLAQECFAFVEREQLGALRREHENARAGFAEPAEGEPAPIAGAEFAILLRLGQAPGAPAAIEMRLSQHHPSFPVTATQSFPLRPAPGQPIDTDAIADRIADAILGGVGRHFPGAATADAPSATRALAVSSGVAPAASAHVLAVLPFTEPLSTDNRGEVLPGSARLVEDLVFVALSGIADLRLVERQHLSLALAELATAHALPTAGASDTLRLGTMLQATDVLTGACSQEGNTITLTLRLIDVGTTLVRGEAQRTVPLARLADATVEAVQELVDRLRGDRTATVGQAEAFTRLKDALVTSAMPAAGGVRNDDGQLERYRDALFLCPDSPVLLEKTAEHLRDMAARRKDIRDEALREAMAHAGRALELTTPGRRHAAALLAASCAATLAMPDEAARFIASAVQDLPWLEPLPQRLLHSEAARILERCGDHAAAREHQTRTVEVMADSERGRYPPVGLVEYHSISHALASLFHDYERQDAPAQERLLALVAVRLAAARPYHALEAIRQLDPTQENPHWLLLAGNIHGFVLLQPENAIDRFQRVQTLTGDSAMTAQAHYGQAAALQLRGDPAQALEHYRLTMASAPDTAWAAEARIRAEALEAMRQPAWPEAAKAAVARARLDGGESMAACCRRFPAAEEAFHSYLPVASAALRAPDKSERFPEVLALLTRCYFARAGTLPSVENVIPPDHILIRSWIHEGNPHVCPLEYIGVARLVEHSGSLAMRRRMGIMHMARPPVPGLPETAATGQSRHGEFAAEPVTFLRWRQPEGIRGWQLPTSTSMRERFRRSFAMPSDVGGEGATGTILVPPGFILTLSPEGVLRGLSPESPQPVWERLFLPAFGFFNTPGDMGICMMRAGAGVLLADARSGAVVLVDPQSGRELWYWASWQSLGRFGTCAVAEDGQVVVVRLRNGHRARLAVDTGRLLKLEPPPPDQPDAGQPAAAEAAPCAWRCRVPALSVAEQTLATETQMLWTAENGVWHTEYDVLEDIAAGRRGVTLSPRALEAVSDALLQRRELPDSGKPVTPEDAILQQLAWDLAEAKRERMRGGTRVTPGLKPFFMQLSGPSAMALVDALIARGEPYRVVALLQELGDMAMLRLLQTGKTTTPAFTPESLARIPAFRRARHVFAREE